jgi:hypothetical protein
MAWWPPIVPQFCPLWCVLVLATWPAALSLISTESTPTDAYLQESHADGC